MGKFKWTVSFSFLSSLSAQLLKNWKLFCILFILTGIKFVSFLPFHLMESSQHLHQFPSGVWYKSFCVLKKCPKFWNHKPSHPSNNRRLFWISLPLRTGWNFWPYRRKCLNLPRDSWCLSISCAQNNCVQSYCLAKSGLQNSHMILSCPLIVVKITVTRKLHKSQ